MNRFVSSSKAFLQLTVVAVFFITCAKEYSYEGGLSGGVATGTALYTLAGEGGDCTGSIITGEYFAGTALTTANTIQLQVHVTTAGTYTLTTNAVNGIYFTVSGNFVDTGMQSITLAGIGTPAAEGSFSFTTPVGLGCSFIVLVNKAAEVIGAFTLGGAPNDCVDPAISGTYLYGVPMTSANYVSLNVNVTAVGPYSITTETIDGISFSASGTFTALGDQRIRLDGSGTPLLPRILTFTPLTGTSFCTFNITVANPEPLATYVLESGFGTPNPCIYIVSGNYTAGTALSSSNTVSIHVYVTVLGNFTIAANTINGISFDYTGTFTTLGAQNVSLIGSGTPIIPGTYTFMPEIVGPHPLGGQTCAFDIGVK